MIARYFEPKAVWERDKEGFRGSLCITPNEASTPPLSWRLALCRHDQNFTSWGLAEQFLYVSNQRRWYVGRESVRRLINRVN